MPVLVGFISYPYLAPAVKTIALLALGGLALAAPALAQPTAPPQRDFGGLWTPWTGANRDAMRAETTPSAPQPQPGTGQPSAGSAALGERVGEMVRLGDCEGGERVAREAGDFPLVEALRAHCRRAVPAVSRDQAIRSR